MTRKSVVRKMVITLLNTRFSELLSFIRDQKVIPDREALDFAFSGCGSIENYLTLVRCIVNDLVDVYDLYVYKCYEAKQEPQSLMALSENVLSKMKERIKEFSDHSENYEKVVSKYCASDEPDTVFEMIMLLALRTHNGMSNAVAQYAYDHQ